jgi:hypothetical protein
MKVTNVFGLPAHPLLVHAVVVLVPLVAAGAVAAVLWPSLRARIGWLLAAGAVLNLVLTPFTVASGEALEERVRESAALESHAEQGQLLLPWVAVLAAAMVLYVVLESRRAKTGAAPPGTPRSWLGRPAALALAAIVVVTAAGSAYVGVLIGHSGAQATWSQIGTTTNDGGDAAHG